MPGKIISMTASRASVGPRRCRAVLVIVPSRLQEAPLRAQSSRWVVTPHVCTRGDNSRNCFRKALCVCRGQARFFLEFHKGIKIAKLFLSDIVVGDVEPGVARLRRNPTGNPTGNPAGRGGGGWEGGAQFPKPISPMRV